MAHHELMGGKLHVYKRDNSRYWQCSTFLGGTNHRVSTKEEGIAQAKDFAEDWYLELRGKHKRGEIKNEKTFRKAAEQFQLEYGVINGSQVSASWAETLREKLRLHLNPFFGDLGLSEITSGKVQEYRMHRMTPPKDDNPPASKNDKAPAKKAWKPPARTTMHHEICTLRQVLKTAMRHGWLSGLPDLSIPYKSAGKVVHRAWFSPEEYKRLYEATRERAANPKTKRWDWTSKQMHDYVLFMANTGLRPDEARRLEFRDVQIVKDDATKETILEIDVRGKRGVGYCKSTTGAVKPFIRLKERMRPVIDEAEEDGKGHDNKAKPKPAPTKKGALKLPEPTDLVFPGHHRELFNQLLDELKLKFDRDGNRRTTYSLRHSYICFRLMEGADIYAIAKNCRTSVEMIEKFYASHIKNTLDAMAINVRRPRKKGDKPLEKYVDE